MTVSMSALSKFSTMKRPRWAGGTVGAVGGAAGIVGVGGVGGACTMREGSGTASPRGPTDRTVDGGSTGAGVGVTAGTGGIGGSETPAVFTGLAPALAKARRTTGAMLGFTALLRGIGFLTLREATQEIRWQRAASLDAGRCHRLSDLTWLRLNCRLWDRHL